MIPVCPVLIDAGQPLSLGCPKCSPPHQDPQNTSSYNGCNTLAVHEVHEVKEEEPASTEVVRSSQWVKWLPQPLLVEHKGQVRERKQPKIRREKEKKNKRNNKTKQGHGLSGPPGSNIPEVSVGPQANNNKKQIKSVNPIERKLEIKK